MSVVISIESLSKKYVIDHQRRETYATFRESLAGGARRFVEKLIQPFRPALNAQPFAEKEEFWALREINAEIHEGDRVGIIGRNGAGKSTLLKILSRITEPTSGKVRIKGRVASLLEVGTGFHPELTGRENIFLNGAILGMSKTEIRRKFDEIVNFAEVDKFLDTPVKRYSSGMYVRLAFAVAAHLEPDTLIVDEVLAVGDAQFQKKCLGKMEEVGKGGRTVLFVSHNMAAIKELCSTGFWLDRGELKSSGDVKTVVGQYLAVNQDQTEYVDLQSYLHRHGTGEAMFEWAKVHDATGAACRDFSIGDDIQLSFGVRVSERYQNKRIKLAVQLQSSDGIKLANMVDTDSGFEIEKARAVEDVSLRIRDVRLYPDTYFLSLWVGSTTSTDVFDHVEDCLSFEIVDGGKLTHRTLPRSAGLIFMTPEWKRSK